ncbi:MULTISPECIES: hypothetical protein [unclassified Paenibacillus]|uniref:hypothetical protein n=1 Tax=unclassified Paenibacillus TaxID=185978 RepID=UPI00117C660E|nr:MULTISPECIES: hypothetical protein [unclassified Paenibacillus]MBY3621388.1 hypothetical protein [Acinetobacter sp. CUI P1]MDH6373001.1 hypothetical protein [Paenibacillus sp. PastF-3]
MKTRNSFHKLLAPIEVYVCADEVGSNHNEEQFNTKYYSGLFHGSKTIRDECSNLQIIAKSVLPDEQWRMAIGTPAILNETFGVH